jgi:hypothetical protein
MRGTRLSIRSLTRPALRSQYKERPDAPATLSRWKRERGNEREIAETNPFETASAGRRIGHRKYQTKPNSLDKRSTICSRDHESIAILQKQSHSGVRGAPPPAREVARQLSPDRHSGRNPKSDRMRRPPSLASERGKRFGASLRRRSFGTTLRMTSRKERPAQEFNFLKVPHLAWQTGRPLPIRRGAQMGRGTKRELGATWTSR